MNQDRPCPYCGSVDANIKFFESPFRVVKCRTCSLVYLGNPPDEGDIYERYYEGSNFNAAEYCETSRDPSLAELFAINMQRISRIKNLRASGTLLDIGCGRGAFLKTAADQSFSVEGIDVSEHAITFARNQFHMNARVDTLENIVSAGVHYDVVTLWHVLEHFSNPFESLELVRSLLKEGGICVLEVPNLHSLKFLTARRKWEGGNHPLYHRTFFTQETLRRGLMKAGFSKLHRLNMSYRIPNRNGLYEAVKGALNWVAMDAFLAFVSRK